MYLAYDEECFRISTTENVEEMSYLRCNHEEAETRIFLHAKDPSQSKDAVVIICEDADIFSIVVSKAHIIGVPIYMTKGTQNRTRFVHITDISTNLGSDLSQNIPGIHTFTWCHSVNAFAGKGKVTALKVLRKHPGKIQVSLKEFPFLFNFEHICFHFSGEGKKEG